METTPTSPLTKTPDDTEVDNPRHPRQTAGVTTYKDCMKNHAAAIGGHAVDGCGEYMPPPSFPPAGPTALTCAACGCHRNFHRRDPPDSPPFLNFRHPKVVGRFSLSPSTSPVPFFEHYPATPTVENSVPMGRKRFRTKFSQDQKEKMHSFSMKVGWKMQKCDEFAVKELCREIGVSKGVLKVWMHNNKNTFGRREIIACGGGIANGGDDGRKIRNGEINGNGLHLGK